MSQSAAKGIFVKPGLFIPEAELSERFIRSSGPGGQNVNKVASCVQLSFDVMHSPSLSERVRAALLVARDGRLGKDGVLTITARQFREQERNRAAARARLADILRHAATPPKPRRATKPSVASKKRGIEAKKRRAGLKRDRSSPFAES